MSKQSRNAVSIVRLSSLAIMIGGLMSAPLALAASDDIRGWWYDESKKGGILIESCGDKLCGKLQWLREPLTKEGTNKLDKENADPALRTRPVCGIAMLSGFSKSEDGFWEGGLIYNPEDGKTYKSNLKLKDDGTLRVRGYVGIPLLGESQIWTRINPAPTPCTVEKQ